MTLKDRYIKTEKVLFSSLQPFQGNLKNLEKKEYTKLVKSIKKDGILTPFMVWESPDGIKMLDGHQRTHVLNDLINSKELPENLSVLCVFLHCEDIKDAKKAILLISSQYGKITQENISDFFSENHLKFDFLQDEAALGSFKPFDFEFDKEEEEEFGNENETDGDIQLLKIPFLPEHIQRARDLFDQVNSILKEKHPDQIKTESDAFLYIMESFVSEYGE